MPLQIPDSTAPEFQSVQTVALQCFSYLHAVILCWEIQFSRHPGTMNREAENFEAAVVIAEPHGDHGSHQKKTIQIQVIQASKSSESEGMEIT